MTATPVPEETVAQQLRRLGRIVTQVDRLGDAEKEWLMRRLAEVECSETSVASAWAASRERRSPTERAGGDER